MFGKTKKEWEGLTGVYTATEITQQPSTWKKTVKQIKEDKENIKAFLDKVLSCDDYDIILTGAGTSEYVGNSVFPYLNDKYDFKVKSYATTDLVNSPTKYLSKTKPTLLVSYGRSGDSPESVGALKVANAVCENIYHLAITCNKDGALSKYAEKEENAYAIDLTPETLDKSFAMTSSYTNMMLATVLCFQLDKLDEIEKCVNEICDSTNYTLENDWKKISDLVSSYDFNRIVYLGSNSLKGVAQESQLKMLELTQGAVTTMFDSPMGFRHGPKSVVNDNTLTVVYVSDDEYTRRYELDLIKEMSSQRKGNKLVVVGNHIEELHELADFSFDIDLPESLDNFFLGLNYIVYAQITALFKSIHVGITPDDPCPSGEVNRVVKGVTIYDL